MDNNKKGKENKTKIIITVIIIFILLILFFVFFNNIIGLFKPSEEKIQSEGQTIFSYIDEFDEFNTDFWWAAKWVTLEDADTDIEINNSVIDLPINETDRGPFLISKPVSVQKGDIIKIKRKVFLHYANEYFDGILMIAQTEDDTFKLKKEENTWDKLMNHPFLVVEYAHYFYKAESRAYTDGFVLRAKDPETDKTFSIIDSVFDEWVTEEITYDTGTGEVVYVCNQKELKGITGILEGPYMRIIMHGYGWYTGHDMKIDSFEIEVIR